MAAQPIGARRTFSRDPRVAHEARPVRQSVGARNSARVQMFSQGNPRLLFRRVLLCDFGDVQQHRFAPFLYGQAAEASGIDTR